MHSQKGLAPIVLVIIAVVLLGSEFFAVARFAEATVGGPTYIYDFRYNPSDEAVYYISASQSGRGCPPILQKLPPRSGASENVVSCEQAEELLKGSVPGQWYPAPLMAKFEEITERFARLTPIHLSKNNISIDLDFSGTEGLHGAEAILRWTKFLATVYQNGRKVSEFPLVGCSREQPFTFAGYAIPGVPDRMMLLSSAKSDCFEGGYIGETLHIVEGIANLDTTYWTNFYKGNEPLIPSEVTLVIFEKDAVPGIASVAENAREDDYVNGALPAKLLGGYGLGAVLALTAVIFMLVGIALGRTLLRKRGTSESERGSGLSPVNVKQGLAPLVWIIIAALILGGGYAAYRYSADKPVPVFVPEEESTISTKDNSSGTAQFFTTILSPNGGETYKIDDTTNVQWKSNITSYGGRIYVATGKGDSGGIVIDNFAYGATSYLWKVGKVVYADFSSTFTLEPGIYRIGVCYTTGLCDWSDSYFTITK